MAGAALTAGVLAYTNAVTTGGTAETVSFVERYNYVAVTNDSTAVLYATTNGTAATTTGNNVVSIPPNATVVIANQLPLWYQSSKVIPQGSAQIPQGGGGGTVSPSNTVLSTPANPGVEQPFQSAGAKALVTNPGTNVSILGGTAAQIYTVTAAG